LSFARLLFALALAGLTGCTTTTTMRSPADDSSTALAVESAANEPRTFARVGPSAPLQPLPGDSPRRVVDHGPRWLTLANDGTAVRVPLDQISSVSSFDRGRGALDGGLMAGAIGFLVTFLVEPPIANNDCYTNGNCTTPSGWTRLEISVLVGAITGAIGAFAGGGIGHETRYEIAPPASGR
jgi:hypothetical protein